MGIKYCFDLCSSFNKESQVYHFLFVFRTSDRRLGIMIVRALFVGGKSTGTP